MEEEHLSRDNNYSERSEVKYVLARSRNRMRKMARLEQDGS